MGSSYTSDFDEQQTRNPQIKLSRLPFRRSFVDVACLTGVDCLRMLVTMLKPIRSDDDAAVLFICGMPRGLLGKSKAAAALQQKTLGEYIQEEMCVGHVHKLERKDLA
jgi:hypothetical protein